MDSFFMCKTREKSELEITSLLSSSPFWASQVGL
jgi:hypothetical protein